MLQELEIKLAPHESRSDQSVEEKIRQSLNWPAAKPIYWQWLRRSIDARRRPITLICKFHVADAPEALPAETGIQYPMVGNKSSVHVIGAGPAGLFAALRLIELGLKPIVIERGKDVQRRRRDLAKITREGVVNPNSNYCFGEGGAGTYSDGKLYTRSTKRGSVSKILHTLIHFGASSDIAVDAHPHIGTNKLPAIISAMREQIIQSGGEVHFDSCLTDLKMSDGRISEIQCNHSNTFKVQAVILATGHSARDIFELLYRKNLSLECKPFAIGVRAEHPQSFVDQCQYKQAERGEFLPPAAYSLVEQVDGTGVFSFCMCPGGIIAPCATNQEEVVTNGWSPSKRNNPYANSGIVVSVGPEDFKRHGFEGPLAGLKYQQMIEKSCWEAAGKTQQAPAQRMADFVSGKLSESLPKCSYQPGIVSRRLDHILPAEISNKLKKAFVLFGKKMPGYFTNDAVLVAPESRTSSPVRIPRNKENLMHPEMAGLIPCGEGAGYAGGIVSAAIDGENCANAAAEFIMQISASK